MLFTSNLGLSDFLPHSTSRAGTEKLNIELIKLEGVTGISWESKGEDCTSTVGLQAPSLIWEPRSYMPLGVPPTPHKTEGVRSFLIFFLTTVSTSGYNTFLDISKYTLMEITRVRISMVYHLTFSWKKTFVPKSPYPLITPNL